MSQLLPITNDLLLRAAGGEETERTPVWMMRQAGRYLPEYRALRAEEAFFEVCRTPVLAAEVTLQPIERFDVDAAIIFSDILVIPQAMGMNVEMVKGHGPSFPEPLRSPADLDRLREPNIEEDLSYVYDAIKLTVERLRGRVPLIGFCGAPWTLMAYMVEGGGSKHFVEVRSWLYRFEDAARELLSRLADVVARHLLGQIRAGARAVQVFDSWAGLLGPIEYEAFVMPSLVEIARRVKDAHPDVPAIIFPRGAHYALEMLDGSPYDVISLDWTMDPAVARERIGKRHALQGNLDPAVLFADPATIRREVRRMLERFGPRGHIANLGHGMHPQHDPEHARVFVDAVHEISEELRREETVAGS